MDKLEKLTIRQIEIIRAYADCDMNTSKTAESVYTNRNTIIYHLQEIKKKTGLDPKRFRDLNKLLTILEKGNDGWKLNEKKLESEKQHQTKQSKHSH